MSQLIRGRAAILFFPLARKAQTLYKMLIYCFLSSFVAFYSAVSEFKMSQPIRGRGRHLFSEKQSFVENVEILLPFKFCWILLSGCRREIQNASANRPFCFSNRPDTDRPRRQFLLTDRQKKHKLGRGRCGVASFQVSLNSVKWFQRRSQKCLSQSEARAATLLLFFDKPEKHNVDRGHWYLASCQVSLNSDQRFQRGKSKMWKFNDGRRTTCDHNNVFEHSAHVN